MDTDGDKNANANDEDDDDFNKLDLTTVTDTSKDKGTDAPKPTVVQQDSSEKDERIKKERALARQSNATAKQLQTDLDKVVAERDDFRSKYESVIREQTLVKATGALRKEAAKANAIDPDLVAEFLASGFNPEKDSAEEAIKAFKKDRPSQFQGPVRGSSNGGSGQSSPAASTGGWLRDALKST